MNTKQKKFKSTASEIRLEGFYAADGLSAIDAFSASLSRDLFVGNSFLTEKLVTYVFARKAERTGKQLSAQLQAVLNIIDMCSLPSDAHKLGDVSFIKQYASLLIDTLRGFDYTNEKRYPTEDAREMARLNSTHYLKKLGVDVEPTKFRAASLDESTALMKAFINKVAKGINTERARERELAKQKAAEFKAAVEQVALDAAQAAIDKEHLERERLAKASRPARTPTVIPHDAHIVNAREHEERLNIAKAAFAAFVPKRCTLHDGHVKTREAALMSAVCEREVRGLSSHMVAGMLEAAKQKAPVAPAKPVAPVAPVAPAKPAKRSGKSKGKTSATA